MCHLFDILVCPVAEYANEIWGFMQAEKMERLHFENTNSRGALKTTPNLASYVVMFGRVLSLIKWKVSMVNLISECQLHC